jgi:hypothetical protein
MIQLWHDLMPLFYSATYADYSAFCIRHELETAWYNVCLSSDLSETFSNCIHIAPLLSFKRFYFNYLGLSFKLLISICGSKELAQPNVLLWKHLECFLMFNSLFNTARYERNIMGIQWYINFLQNGIWTNVARCNFCKK